MSRIRDGVVGNISACHADARGSIPRRGALYFLKNCCPKKDVEARGIRTPNLRVWNPTRCHCAMGSRLVSMATQKNSFSVFWLENKKPAVGVEPTTPSLRSLCNNHYATRASSQPVARVELATLCLQGRCNNHYATPALMINLIKNYQEGW